MNIHGYYDADDIWVPDPHEKEHMYHQIINEFQLKSDKQAAEDAENTTFLSEGEG